MVATCNDLLVSATLLLDDGVRAVSADVVEGVDVSLSITVDNEVESRDFVAEPVPCLLETRAVGDEQPSPREDRTALELIHLLNGIP